MIDQKWQNCATLKEKVSSRAFYGIFQECNYFFF